LACGEFSGDTADNFRLNTRMMNETLKARVRDRLKALNKTPRAASVDAGLHPDTIRNVLRERSRKPRADSLAKMARALECSVDWLMESQAASAAAPEPATPIGLWETAEAPPPRADMPRDVPVLGTAAGSARGAFQVDMAAIDFVRRPPGIGTSRDVYALYVVGSSMSPRFEEGELIYVSERRPARVGDYVVVQTIDPVDGSVQAYCKRLVRRSDDALLLDQLNPAAEIRLPMREVRAVHRILTLNELFGL
jgi:phage repressor protein C with HTH and peptisase S24 domain